MRYILAVAGLCVVASSNAFAACPASEEINVLGHNVSSGGLVAWLNDAGKDCDDHTQPAWLVTINAAPVQNGSAPGLTYCRQIAASKDPQNEAKRRDCIYWYGHSIEAP